MTSWYPGLTGIDDKGFGGSRNGEPINGVVEHHTANGGGASALGYVANQNSRNSHPNYLIQNSGKSFGIVHPNRRPFSTAGRPDTEAIAFEIDNESGAPDWRISDAAAETLAQIIAYHYKNSPRFGHGIARNIPGKVQDEFFVAWHSQYVATTCPGPNIRDQRQSAIIARALQIAHPAPIDPNVNVAVGALVGCKSAFGVYASAALARAGGSPKTTYPAGNYTVYKVAGDAVNLTKTAGKAGGWVTIAGAGLVAPVLPTIWNVVFDDSPDDPTSDYAKVQVEQGQPVAKPTIDPKREGFEFVGWFDLNGSTSVPYDFSKPVKGLLTLVAQFVAVPVVEPEPEPEPQDWTDELNEIDQDVSAATAGDDAPLAGLFAGNDRGRKRAYLVYAGAALLISFGPDVVVANVLADNVVPTFVAYVSLSASILLKIGTALGFVAAANTRR